MTIRSRLIAGYKINAVASSQCFIFIYASCAVPLLVAWGGPRTFAPRKKSVSNYFVHSFARGQRLCAFTACAAHANKQPASLPVIKISRCFYTWARICLYTNRRVAHSRSRSFPVVSGYPKKTSENATLFEVYRFSNIIFSTADRAPAVDDNL